MHGAKDKAWWWYPTPSHGWRCGGTQKDPIGQQSDHVPTSLVQSVVLAIELKFVDLWFNIPIRYTLFIRSSKF